MLISKSFAALLVVYTIVLQDVHQAAASLEDPLIASRFRETARHRVHLPACRPAADRSIDPAGVVDHDLPECDPLHYGVETQSTQQEGVSTSDILGPSEEYGDDIPVIDAERMREHINEGLAWLAQGAVATHESAQSPFVARAEQGGKKSTIDKSSEPDNLSAPQSSQADYTKLVNPFIGTGATSNPGNVFPGAAIPFGMAKFGIDVDEYAPAGYNDDPNAPVRGLSLLHDSGTGSSSGSYGNFESMPVICTNDDANLCPVTLDERKRIRSPGKDAAHPGYFTTTLDNGIKMETTTTRRAGLIRYTWPKSALEKQKAKNPFIVFDWSNDLPGTFRGGEMTLDPEKGRMAMNGSWASSFGSQLFTYRAYVCYDLFAEGQQQIDYYGLFEGNRFGQDEKVPRATHATQPRSEVGGQPPQRGALISWSKTMSSGGLTKRLLPFHPGALRQQNPQILLRAGVSFVSSEQACMNAEQEIPSWNFDEVEKQSKDLWNEKLRRLQISPQTDKSIVQLIYSSFYRSFLSPNNATLEAQGVFEGTTSPYFDGIYCSWDVVRGFYSLLSLTSPEDYAEIVENYVDSWRKNGYIVECRANNVPGLTQGGSDGTNIIADYAVKYRNANLGVDIAELYEALFNDATQDTIEWTSGGRQIGVYEKYGYIPFGAYDRKTSGIQTREGSRTLEYAFNDFGIRNVAILVGKTGDADRWTKRALFYKNVYDKNTKSFGYDMFVQRRYPNGTFGSIDPTTCSPIDNNPKHACSLQQENNFTIYESSSWEYSLFAPHDFAGLIKLLSKGDHGSFIKRVDTFFEKKLYYSGNEPSFQTPISYHYANRPTLSVDRVRDIVFTDFNTTASGLPGNDDNGAMASLLLFHLLGLYPVPSTREYLVVSPFLPQYTFTNTLLGTVTVTAKNFDSRSVQKKIPSGARAYVKSVSINGKQQSSRCKIMFDDLFPAAAQKGVQAMHTDVVFEMGTKDEVPNCGSSESDLPSSMSTGGFDKF